MRVPAKVLWCVGYIGEVTDEPSDGTFHGDLCATGFFVHLPSKRFPNLKFAYFVTAKHVAKDLENKKVFILVNSKNGGTTYLKTIYPQWWTHPTDQTTDLAILQVAKQDDVETWAAGMKDFVTADDIKQERAAIGDEVFITGLFTEAPGQTRNMPLVRHGNVAMFPQEQIQTELGYADVYLIEARSIGGLSGSPAFVRSTVTVPVQSPDGSLTTFSGVGDFKLLGLMHGHWDIKESDMNKAPIIHNRQSGVNLGIAIVVPAYKIRETLEQPDLVKSREMSEEDLGRLQKSVPGRDSAKQKQEPQENAITKADFEAALKKASRKI